MSLLGNNSAGGSSESHLSQVEEKAGVLSGLRQVRQEHGDTDQQDCGVLTHLPQRLKEREASLLVFNLCTGTKRVNVTVCEKHLICPLLEWILEIHFT